uniref:Uncharacterized protein n=1 Tax=Anguilla anguilla TaxID=7936 RepID=A0A0E9XBU1_ANGAN
MHGALVTFASTCGAGLCLESDLHHICRLSHGNCHGSCGAACQQATANPSMLRSLGVELLDGVVEPNTD